MDIYWCLLLVGVLFLIAAVTAVESGKQQWQRIMGIGLLVLLRVLVDGIRLVFGIARRSALL